MKWLDDNHCTIGSNAYIQLHIPVAHAPAEQEAHLGLFMANLDLP